MNYKYCVKYVSLSAAALFFGSTQCMDSAAVPVKLHSFDNLFRMSQKQYSKKELTEKDSSGCTLLWRLVMEKKKSEVANALTHGADPNVLQTGIAQQPEHMLGWVIAHRDYDDERQGYDYGIAESLLEHGAKPNFQDPLFDVPLIHILNQVKDRSLRDARFNRPLDERGMCSFIQNLVNAYKADPNVCSQSGEYPLMLVSYFSNPEVQTVLAQCFLDHGAELEKENLHGRTALLYLAEGPCDATALAAFLVSRGANIRHRDKYNNSVIRLVAVAAITHPKPNLYKYLLEKAPELKPKGRVASCCLERLGEK